MNRRLLWKLIAGCLLVFFAGGMTGVFLYSSYARQAMFEPPGGGRMAERIRERLRKELNLTPDQVEKISPIIDRTAAQLEQIRHETGQRISELITNAHREMALSLTDEQRVKLQQLEERRHQWRQHFRERAFHRWHSLPATPAASPAP